MPRRWNDMCQYSLAECSPRDEGPNYPGSKKRINRTYKFLVVCRRTAQDEDMALNFNRQFIEILPNNKTGNRNQSILQLTRLQDRIVTDYADCSISERMIDYERVNDILRKERIRSLGIVKQLLRQ